MEEEVAKLKDMMTEVEIQEAAGMSFCQGRLYGKEIVVVRSGIGKVNAAMCAQTMILRYHPRLIINTGVAGGMLQHKRVVRRSFVQQALVRRTLFPQGVVVIPARHHPLPCRNIVFTNKPPYLFTYIFIALCALQPHLQKRVCIAGKMAVRIDERRQQGTARKVHPLCTGCHSGKGLQRARRTDDAALLQKCLSIQRLLHSKDGPSII